VTTVASNSMTRKRLWLPSVPVAAYAPVALAAFGAHSDRAVATGFGPARKAVIEGYGINGSTVGAFAGEDMAVIDTQLTGDVRGVPPRGRPV